MKFELSKDSRHWHRLWSVWCAFAVVVVSCMEIASQMGLGIAPLWKEIIDPDTYPKIVAGLSTLGIVARFIKQSCLSIKENEIVSTQSDSPAS